MIDAFHRQTIYVMALAWLLAALVMMAPGYAVYYNVNWPAWTHGFPLEWIAVCVSYMTVFFHELGHVLAYWLYGVVAVPAFNLAEGGGVTMPLTEPLLVLRIILYGILLYVFVHYPQKSIRAACVVIALFQIITFYAGWHKIIFYFAGALAESLIAGYMLWRAWFDRAPRGVIERFLNAFFGFSLAFQALLRAWALRHDDIVRQVYQDNAGSVLVSDFNKLADLTDFPFLYMVDLWFTITLICMIVPCVQYCIWRVRLSRFEFQSRLHRGF
jgi:hypothetical protein